MFRYRRKEIGASAAVLLMALGFDAVVPVAFTAMKLESDPAIVVYALIAIAAVSGFERRDLSRGAVLAADCSEVEGEAQGHDKPVIRIQPVGFPYTPESNAHNAA